MLRKLFVLVSLVLIAAFALSACGPAATTAAPATDRQPADPDCSRLPTRSCADRSACRTGHDRLVAYLHG